MKWLNYITLNCVAPLSNLHEISDAGAGKGLMHLHPTRDTELIACGLANTQLNGKFLPSPVLGNGSVTPAILVHGVFNALQSIGFKIRVHCYQLGLDSEPDFTDSTVDECITYHCPSGEEQALIQNTLIPELVRQSKAGEHHIIAESGIGGTTFATLWLRRWIDPNLWFAGSTNDALKLAIKSKVLELLWEKSSNKRLDVDQYIRDLECSDPLQRAVCYLLRSRLSNLNLAGGAMLFAPVAAMMHGISVKHLNIATTRWVMQSTDAQNVADHLSQLTAIKTNATDFNLSAFEAIRMYERGYVVEGCGLGACLVFAEDNGLTERQIIDYLDRAVRPWVDTASDGYLVNEAITQQDVPSLA
ncbi:hypothetical protein AB4560_13180 [Vibrio sp. 10N.222.51.C12]|uniref:hypothetical protein n=1 Tax=unclassified Vibrio TaxID=2614977 RepID=UPI000C829091|nr:hypothetical protein [Vibrio sp. 10N.286.48.B7]PMH77710.1 hypothetical protein BCU58_12050 [Vibrio sp. 10N.286.48.B7]